MILDNLSKPNPELRDIRELIMNPYLRSQSKVCLYNDIVFYVPYLIEFYS